jgi:hypothetical protein
MGAAQPVEQGLAVASKNLRFAEQKQVIAIVLGQGGQQLVSDGAAEVERAGGGKAGVQCFQAP